MGRRYFLQTSLLKEGMKVDQSLVDKTGRVLIARGIKLDRYLIDALKRLEIRGVYIREGEDDKVIEMSKPISVSKAVQKKIESLTVEDRSRVTLSESVKKRVQEGISYLYSNTNAEDFADASKSIASELLKAIDANDALAVDISMLKVSDEYTFKHSVDVATMAMVVAKKMGFSQEEVYDVGVAGLLHDLGKSKVPPEILNKPGKLTDEEFEIMKTHTVSGGKIILDTFGHLGQAQYNEMAYEVARHHHEKWNGKGYPDGLKEEEIPLCARIMAIADVFDAISEDRCYRKAMPLEQCFQIIEEGSGRDFDPVIAEVFLDSREKVERIHNEINTKQ